MPESDGWPAWASAAIEIHPYSPAWPQAAAQEIDDLTGRLARWSSAPMEHIGSTSIPGLAAKPIIDLMAGVRSLDCGRDVEEALSPHGWNLVPAELDDRPWRLFFVKVVDGHRSAHLHLVEAESAHWHRHLRFRDRLRVDARLAAEYSHLKMRLASQFADDREGYTRAKADFVEGVLRSIS